MKTSEELKSIYHRICEALSAGDGSFFERQFSQYHGVLAIGTDPNEWWDGYLAITKIFKTQLEEAGGFNIKADAPVAYSEGSIGWMAGRPTLSLQDGSEISFRLTAVLQKEEDGWKIVQWHFSAGISNEDLIGKTLTKQ